MTPNNSTLKINRFLVIKSSRAVYDQEFHSGVNIIRGDNSVGKSTIMDLIYFCLGGDLREERWNNEARSCDSTVADVTINGKRLTLLRPIAPNGKPPIMFFSGPYEASNAPDANWTQYGIIRTDNKYSFSQQLFELLNWPAHQADDSSNLTMHQILRLIYVDQDTPVNKILKYEPSMDKPNMRQAIGEFLLGIDDLETYGIRQKLSKAENEFSKIQGQLEAVYRIISPTEGILRTELLEKEISTVTQNIKDLSLERDNVILTPSEDIAPNLKEEAEILGRNIKSLTDEISIRFSRKAEITNEIVESELFLSSIDFRIKSLQESRTAFDYFGEVRFKFCPSCLAPIKDSDHTLCHLCKNSINEDSRDSSYLAALNELNFQKKESKKVLEEHKHKLKEITELLNAEIRQLESLKAKSRSLLMINSQKMVELSSISSTIGSMEEKLSNLTSKIELVASVERLIEKKATLNSEIEAYREKIKQNKIFTEARRENIESNLSERTINLITQDGGFEESFINPSVFQFDFQKDIMLVDGRSKFSASSETILKNSFHFAIFIASLYDNLMRYPRLLLLDNIEDKGMRPERSQNFQRLIVAALDDVNTEHQVIMSTSMIADDLEATKYCVGPYYKKGMHTLVFSTSNKKI